MMDLAGILLALLTLHRTGTSIALHEAKSRTHFSTALAVLLGEVLKQIISFIIAFYTTVQQEEDRYEQLPTTSSPIQEKEFKSSPWTSSSSTYSWSRMSPFLRPSTWKALKAKIFDRKALVLLVPAAIYVAQNNLFLYAAGKLRPSLFQALWQLRLIPTAYFSQLLLGKRIGGQRWLTLLGLVAGVIVIQSSFSDSTQLDTSNLFSYEQLALLTPVFALLLSAVLAALAGVLLEGIFKQEGTDIWVANLQLSTFSLVPCLILVTIEAQNSPHGFSSVFADFRTSYWPWVAVIINGSSGVLVALVTKHAGSIANNISGIASIATTHMLELTFSNAPRSSSTIQQLEFYFGMAVVIVSSYYYMTLAASPKPISEELNSPNSHAQMKDRWDDDEDEEEQFGTHNENGLGITLHPIQE